MSSFRMRQATPDDADDIAKVNYAANGLTNVLYQAFFQNDLQVVLPQAFRYCLEKGEEFFTLAVDQDSEKTVGYCRYKVVEPKQQLLESESKTTEADDKSESPSPAPQLKEHLQDLWKQLRHNRDEMDETYERASAGQKHYYLEQLMIHPEHQRKGIGRTLLSAVLDKADAEGLPTFLQSSRDSHPLYLQLGFKDMGIWTLNNPFFAKEIVKLDQNLGLKSVEGLVERSQIQEEEAMMLRQAKLAAQ